MCLTNVLKEPSLLSFFIKNSLSSTTWFLTSYIFSKVLLFFSRKSHISFPFSIFAALEASFFREAAFCIAIAITKALKSSINPLGSDKPTSDLMRELSNFSTSSIIAEWLTISLYEASPKRNSIFDLSSASVFSAFSVSSEVRVPIPAKDGRMASIINTLVGWPNLLTDALNSILRLLKSGPL